MMKLLKGKLRDFLIGPVASIIGHRATIFEIMRNFVHGQFESQQYDNDSTALMQSE